MSDTVKSTKYVGAIFPDVKVTGPLMGPSETLTKPEPVKGTPYYFRDR